MQCTKGLGEARRIGSVNSCQHAERAVTASLGTVCEYLAGSETSELGADGPVEVKAKVLAHTAGAGPAVVGELWRVDRGHRVTCHTGSIAYGRFAGTTCTGAYALPTGNDA